MMRTRVSRAIAFEAAHHLPWHAGKCQRLHRLEVTVEGPVNEHGVVMDFDDMAAVLEREVVSRYDHRLLNDVLDNPTAERIAQQTWKYLEAAGLNLVSLRLWETPQSMVELLAG
jgi:6-pyruvoyltetrahydropterin/6-carboxytetrahydropterin synthase